MQLIVNKCWMILHILWRGKNSLQMLNNLAGPLRGMNSGRPGNHPRLWFWIFVFTCSSLQIDAPHNFYVMPIPHLLLIGSFWKNSCARLLVAGFCITAHYFSIFPLNWVVGLHCRYWRMDCRHRCYFALILGLFCAMSVYVLYKFECSTGKHSWALFLTCAVFFKISQIVWWVYRVLQLTDGWKLKILMV